MAQCCAWGADLQRVLPSLTHAVRQASLLPPRLQLHHAAAEPSCASGEAAAAALAAPAVPKRVKKMQRMFLDMEAELRYGMVLLVACTDGVSSTHLGQCLCALCAQQSLCTPLADVPGLCASYTLHAVSMPSQAARQRLSRLPLSSLTLQRRGGGRSPQRG